MTFKKNLYGNFSTQTEIEMGQWEYGQNACMAIVSVSLVIEFLVFMISFGQMLLDLIKVLLSAMSQPKKAAEKKNKSKRKKKKKPKLKRFANGVFFKLALKKKFQKTR